jgi:flagellar protein FliO/FliZ
MIVFLLAAGDALSPLSTGWLDYAKTLLVLGGISVLAFVAVRFWLPRLARFRSSASNHIQVYARYPLEPRKTLYIVKAGKSMMLLGSSNEGLQFMTSLDEAGFESSTVNPTPSADGKFNRLLRSIKT